jgi:hypothetical protein
MKSDSNTEMELLLRRQARRRKSMPAVGATDASAREGNEQTGGPHMDADEMNAYAENALPAPARARYMAHLADCDNCRAIVTNLTLAANVPLEDAEGETQQATSPKRSWREWLAALLSPPLIRYGVPALVLISVVGIVFLAIRQRGEERRSDEPALVARNNERSETQNTSILKPEAGQSPATLASPTLREDGPTPAQPKEGEAAQSAAAPADKEALAKTKQTNEQAREPENLSIVQNEPTASPASEASRQERAARDQRDEDLAAAAPRQAAPPPVTLARPSAGATSSEVKESDRIGQNRKDDSTRDDRPGVFGTTSNTASREAEERQATTAAKSAPATAARRRAAPKVRTMTEGADANASGDAAGGRSSATREVGGRRFRRQGSAWVDTAYSQGRATINVTRGSEQYRALTADEPGLRAIADQLGGEVIVVWKGRAYRIR